ncbi:hypothetical protein HYX18_00380 [Candidatus Woesearchaeota archaeon]|nr:hypothetical protein [Candidatus Woesearchaeota archaeon]
MYKSLLKARSIIIGIMTALAIFVFLGMISVLVPNPFFKRMTQIYFYDYIFLVLTSLLLGAYIGLWYYKKNSSSMCNYAAAGEATGGFFSFGCAICNKLLIWVLGLSGVVSYFMPIQPILGVISILLLAYVVYLQSKSLYLTS